MSEVSDMMCDTVTPITVMSKVSYMVLDDCGLPLPSMKCLVWCLTLVTTRSKVSDMVSDNCHHKV